MSVKPSLNLIPQDTSVNKNTQMSEGNQYSSLETRIWWTRKARIQAEKRLLFFARQSQALLLWYSFISVIASIYYLKYNSSSEYASIAWVVFSVLTLCMSCFINGFRFEERAGLIKECYEALCTLHEKAKDSNSESTQYILDDYKKILGTCENHTDIDYYLARFESRFSYSKEDKSKPLITKFIYISIFIHVLTRRIILLSLYIVPIGLFWLIEI